MLMVDIQKKLNHFTLDVQFSLENEILVLFGPSGSGKTTILENIAGLSHPDNGSIVFNDHIYFKINSKPLAVQSRKIGYLFQDFALFPHMTVQKNILYGVTRTDTKHVDTIVEALGIHHLLRKYPGQISGGEKQRVALARALATEPRLLLLDEPFSALDNQTRMQCHEQLIDLHKQWKIPIILVTHNWDEAKKLGNKILFIEKGKFVECTQIAL